jgi:hypothetical protein
LQNAHGIFTIFASDGLPMTPAQNTLRNVRVVHITFLATCFLYIVVLNVLHLPKRSVAAEIQGSFVLLACAEIGVAFFLRRRTLAPAEDMLRTNPNDITALGKWRVGNALSFVFAESIMVLGFALKFLGASWRISGIFFAVGILLLLLWTPRLEVPTQ